MARSPDRRPVETARNVRGEATGELILVTAERLFGGSGASKRCRSANIGLAAGQKNNFAVQYYFGDRENLLQAIAEYRAMCADGGQHPPDYRSRRRAGQVPTVGDFVRAFVTALSANLDEHSHFLPFISPLHQ